MGNAIHGLVPAAVGHSRLAEAALDYLRAAKRSGHEELIRKAVKAAPSDAAKRVQRDVLDREEKVYTPFDEDSSPKWLHKGIAAASKLKPPKLPSWADPTTLPPLVMGDHRLDDAQTQAVLTALGPRLHRRPAAPPRRRAQARRPHRPPQPSPGTCSPSGSATAPRRSSSGPSSPPASSATTAPPSSSPP